SAIGLAGALLQDPVGGLSTRQPPNFAHLLNTMYVLGGEVAGQTAARRWFEAASYYSNSGKLKALEKALAETSLRRFLPEGLWPPTTPRELKKSIPDQMPSWWRRD